VAVELSAENARMLYVPVGFAHGFCTLTPDTEVAYKVTDVYAPRDERSVLWNDPDLGIAWPFAPDQVTLSEKDRAAPRLRDLPPAF
jgi:dTDP-4-dehydrorhamnose 3,5-epimerase